MLRPFTAYLRVYEPLPAFGDPPDSRLQATVRASVAKGVRPADAGHYELVSWLRSQLTGTLLPAQLPSGEPAPSDVHDVLVRDPEAIPNATAAEVGPGPLVCPLELRARSAAALMSFLDDAHPAMRAMVGGSGASVDEMRAHAGSVLGEVSRSAMHVLSVNWAVPLPWFALIDPAERMLRLGQGPHDPARELSWRVAIADARRRVAEARELAENNLGDEGPSRILGDTERWLTEFHDGAAVELDYGGLVQLIDDETLQGDTTAETVHEMVAALRAGEVEQLTELFQNLRSYWADLGAHERYN